VKLGA
jgi:hypothetical protein